MVRQPLVLKSKYFIDSHKCANAPVILLIMWHHGALQNPTAWVYLALHGTYGFRTLKSLTFGDKQWERRTSIGMGLATWAVLSLYWIAPWIIASRGVQAPAWYLGLSIAIYAFGVFFHFVSDMQKHMALSLRPGQLVTGGLWSRTRNPNYFGELLIYGGFTMLAMHWLPLAVLGLVIAAVWVPNMVRKDRSLSRYREFAVYKAQTRLIVPYLI
jgi:protein-S-isoprenylcysteine O-methyltransferase Ste14